VIDETDGDIPVGLLEAHSALAGKNAVIIGGAGGVGRAVTLALAKAGVRIATCDVDPDAVGAIVSEVEALGQKIISLHADVCDPPTLERFYDRVEAEFNHLDILVNLAGGVKRSAFMDSTREQNAREIRLNYGYVLDSVRRAVPLIRKSGRGGSIVNFTTIEAQRGAATLAVYAGAKAANTNFTRALAVELGAEGIRVNTLAPDTTPAKGSYGSMAPEDLAKFEAMPPEIAAKGIGMYVPQKRNPPPEALADGVLFLVSDLSACVTGITLHIDGGTNAAMGFIDWPFGDGFMPAPLAGTTQRLFGGE
jgi:NAD(P)-dependent dehydrogenase (short-subunit alcohol dehydrogenase family)